MGNSMVMSRKVAFPDAAFPLEVKEISQYCPLRPHRHDDFVEIVLVTSGKGVHRIGSTRQNIAAGDLLVVPGGWVHTYDSIVDLRYFNILLVPGRLNLDWADLPEHPGYRGLLGEAPPDREYDSFYHMDKHALDRARSMASDLHVTLVRRAPGYRFRALAQLLTLLDFFCDGYITFKHAGMPDATQRLSLLVNEMEQRYSEEFSVELLCRKAGMSRAVLFREFKRYYNVAPMEYLMRIRLRQACHLLLQSELPVGEIAARCGFCDHSYFSLQFRRRMNMAPGDFRRGEAV